MFSFYNSTFCLNSKALWLYTQHWSGKKNQLEWAVCVQIWERFTRSCRSWPPTVSVVTVESERHESVYMLGALRSSPPLKVVLSHSGISRETGRNVRDGASPWPVQGASTRQWNSAALHDIRFIWATAFFYPVWQDNWKICWHCCRKLLTHDKKNTVLR